MTGRIDVPMIVGVPVMIVIRSVAVIMDAVMRMKAALVVMGRGNHRRLARLHVDHRRFIALAAAVCAHQGTSSSSIALTFNSSPRTRLNRIEPHGQAVSMVGVGNSVPHISQRAIAFTARISNIVFFRSVPPGY